MGRAWPPPEGKVDPYTESLITVDYAHHEIHDGMHFYVQYSVLDLGAMTTPNDTITLTFTTPNTTRWGNFTFFAKGSAGWRVRLIEAPTGGATGPTEQLTIKNKNRNSANTSTMTAPVGGSANTVDYDSTLATGGTTLWDEYLEGSGGPQAGGTSDGSDRNELVLKQNTKYQLSIFGTDANPAVLYMAWYEHISDT